MSMWVLAMIYSSFLTTTPISAMDFAVADAEKVSCLAPPSFICPTCRFVPS